MIDSPFLVLRDAAMSAAEAFQRLAEMFTYPPALAAMVERRDRFVKNAARLDVCNMSKRQRAKAGRWRRAAERERRRIKQHPHFLK